MTDILDIAVTHLANDDYNHVPEAELRARLARLRGTHSETRLEEAADVLIYTVRDALQSFATRRVNPDKEYGPR